MRNGTNRIANTIYGSNRLRPFFIKQSVKDSSRKVIPERMKNKGLSLILISASLTNSLSSRGEANSKYNN